MTDKPGSGGGMRTAIIVFAIVEFIVLAAVVILIAGAR
jgi:hypothetical protein